MGITNTEVAKFFDTFKVDYQVINHLDCSDDDRLILNQKFDYIIKSPGINPHLQFFEDAKQLNIPVITDLELFYLIYPRAKIIAITGTNGKTTTALLVYQLLLTTNYKVHLGGNIGIPLFSLVSTNQFIDEIVIIEASSFMLENTISFAPYIAIFLNLSHHHLDYHLNYYQYLNAKLKITNNQTDRDWLIINTDLLKEFPQITTNAKIIEFDQYSLPPGYLVDQDGLSYQMQSLIEFKNTPWEYLTNQLNLRALLSVAFVLNISYLKVLQAMKNFEFAKYRIQKVNHPHLAIYNDSKSTTLEASYLAIKSLVNKNLPLYWIVGGKKSDQTTLDLTITDQVNTILIVGENQEQLASFLNKHHRNYQCFSTLDEVVKSLIPIKDQKIQILFSPGFQSYDQYQNFQARGVAFNELVDKYLS